jgi:hypothetical protein
LLSSAAARLIDGVPPPDDHDSLSKIKLMSRA